MKKLKQIKNGRVGRREVYDGIEQVIVYESTFRVKYIDHNSEKVIRTDELTEEKAKQLLSLDSMEVPADTEEVE